MSTKRQPSKQRRQTQNQRQRAAIEARRQAAAAGPVPAGKVGRRSTSGAASSPARSGSVLSRLRGAQAPARGARPAPAAGHTPVGHRAALSAVLAAMAGAVVGAVLLQVPIARDGDAITSREALVAEWAITASEAIERRPDATPTELAASIDSWLPGGRQPYARAFWPSSALLLLPVLGAGLGFRAVSKRASAKIVNRTMYVMLFGSLLVFQLSLVFLPAVLSMAVAAFQVRKAEALAGSAAARTSAADEAPDEDHDEVNDVDAVADDVDEEV